MEQSSLLKKIGVFLSWLLVCVLGALIFFIANKSLSNGMAALYVRDSADAARRQWVARGWDRGYVVLGGLGYLIFVFAIEGYLSDGVERRDLLRRITKVTGIELLLIFLADLFNVLLQKALFGRYSLLLLAVELIVGGGLLAFSLRAAKKPPQKPKTSP